MYLKHKGIIRLIIFLCLFFMIFCYIIIDLNNNNMAFAVVYSDAMNIGSEIVVYNENGDIINSQLLADGQALYYFNKLDNMYLLMSERKNRHYILDPKGNVESFFGPNNYEKDGNIGTSFLNRSENYLLYSMNIGVNPKYSPDSYSSEFVYLDIQNNTLKNIKLKGYLQSAVEYNDKAYILNVKNGGSKSCVDVLDLKDGKHLAEIPLNNQHVDNDIYTSLSIGSSFQIFKDKLIVIMTGNTKESYLKPIMKIINLDNNCLEKEIQISSKPFIFYETIIYKDKLYLFSEDLSFAIFSDLQGEPEVNNFKPKSTINEGTLSGIQLENDYVYMLYDYVKNVPQARVREIQKYDLHSGEEKRVIPLKYSSKKELIRFFTME